LFNRGLSTLYGANVSISVKVRNAKVKSIKVGLSSETEKEGEK